MVIDKGLTAILSTSGVKDVGKAKTMVYAAAGVAVFITGALIVRGIVKRRADRQALKDMKNYDVVDRDKELSNLGINSRNLTISNGDAIVISQNFLTAMDKWGTDTDAIYQNLDQLETKDDLLLVIQKFGSKPYSGTGLAESWWTRTGYFNLNGWFRKEMTKKQLGPVIEKYKQLGVPF